MSARIIARNHSSPDLRAEAGHSRTDHGRSKSGSLGFIFGGIGRRRKFSLASAQQLADATAELAEDRALVTNLQQALSEQTAALYQSEKERDEALTWALTISEELGGEINHKNQQLAARDARILELEAAAAAAAAHRAS